MKLLLYGPNGNASLPCSISGLVRGPSGIVDCITDDMPIIECLSPLLHSLDPKKLRRLGQQ